MHPRAPLSSADLRQSCRVRAVFAFLDRADFERARVCLSGFERWDCYDEFVIERDSQMIGLGTSGLETRQVDVALNEFIAWTRLTGTPRSLVGLDNFVQLIWLRRTNPEWEVAPVASHGDNRAGHYFPGRLFVPVCAAAYGSWKNSMKQGFTLTDPCLPETYASLVAEKCLGE